MLLALNGAGGTRAASVACYVLLVRDAYTIDLTNMERQTALQPPKYLTRRGHPHKHGMFVDHPPLCSRCKDETETHRKLKYHDPDRSSALIEAGLLNDPTGRAQETVSKESTLRHRRERDTVDKTVKTTPGDSRPDLVSARLKWMKLLPSEVIPHIKPPPHSVLQRRNSFPYIEHTRYSTPFTTPPLFPRSLTLQRAELARAIANLDRARPRKRHCHYPLFETRTPLASSEFKGQPAPKNIAS
jgi:hypothetical protein